MAKPMTGKQKKKIAKQRAGREARGQKAGGGPEGFRPPRGKPQVEVRRMGQEQFDQFLKKKGAEVPERTKFYKTKEGKITARKESIYQKEGEAPPSVLESVGKSVGLGAAAGVAVYTAGRLILPLAGRVGTRLLASRGSSIPNIIRTAGGGKVHLSKFGRIITSKAGLITKPAANTKNAARAVSFMSKLASTAKKPSIVLGVIAGTIGLGAGGVGMFGMGEWGEKEGLEGLSFAYREAVESNDTELAYEIRETYQEARDLVGTEEFKDFIPFVQVPEVIRKINIKVDAADSLVKSMDAKLKKLEEQNMDDYYG